MNYCAVGFMFDEKCEKVALILKNRPDWQAGKFNGIGGHCLSGERYSQCVKREFYEETGVLYDDWLHIVTLEYPNASKVSFFRAATDDVFNVCSKTDELVFLFDVKGIDYSRCVFNLNWLIPLCLDPYVVDAGVVKCTHFLPS